jgi:2-polyprenyl-3-methyl-5-hydroxy-6-metoxy-1,4-benzoquinol methylase
LNWLTNSYNSVEITNFKDEFPLISFVMPVYNDAKTVEAAIDSIFDNDWPSIEVVAVDDGSPDGAGKVLDSLKKKYKNLTVLHFDKNKGACTARNEGAKLAKGKYLAWLPADAKIFPGMIRSWVETLEKNPEYDFLYGGYRFINDNGDIVSNYESETFEPYLLECHNYIDGSFPIKTETYWRVAKLMNQPDGLWDPNIKSLQDWDFWLSVVKEGKGKGLYFRDIFFETYMPHPGGLSYDSHANWLARTRAIKLKHNIPIRKICVTAPGAPFFAKYIAYLLDADFSYCPQMKDHDYDMIYILGFYPSIMQACSDSFVNPKYYPQMDDFVKAKKDVPLTAAIKVVHLIGTDLMQMQYLSLIDRKIIGLYLNGIYDHCLTEFEETQKEAKQLGIESDVLALPPRRYYEPDPFPKDFTVAVYAPPTNQELYSLDIMKKVAKELPKFKFKFFGDPSQTGKVEGNIEHVGYIYDMGQLIKESSCLMRITVHDGLPQSVLEFLSAGRRVVFNHELKHVNMADKKIEVKALVKALKEESEKGLNEEAAKWVRTHFDKKKYKDKIYSLLTYDAKKFWDKTAKHWNRLVDEGMYTTKDWDVLEPMIGDTKKKSVIDVGCGEGQWSEKFEGEYLGIDISESLIKSAQKKHPGKKFVCSTLQDFKADKKFDLAFCYTVFEHIVEEEMPKAVEALRKIAKQAIIVEPENIKTKNYCTNHDYNKWFKISKRRTIGPRTVMVVDL